MFPDSNGELVIKALQKPGVDLLISIRCVGAERHAGQWVLRTRTDEHCSFIYEYQEIPDLWTYFTMCAYRKHLLQQQWTEGVSSLCNHVLQLHGLNLLGSSFFNIDINWCFQRDALRLLFWGPSSKICLGPLRHFSNITNFPQNLVTGALSVTAECCPPGGGNSRLINKKHLQLF